MPLHATDRTRTVLARNPEDVVSPLIEKFRAKIRLIGYDQALKVLPPGLLTAEIERLLETERESGGSVGEEQVGSSGVLVVESTWEGYG